MYFRWFINKLTIIRKNIKNAEDYWSNQINLFDKKKLSICYFGAIGFQSNWDQLLTRLN